jgi:uncharacterized protein (UPF0548 family)
MLHLGRVSPEQLRKVAAARSGSRLTYEAQGATLTGDLPAGFRHERHEIDLASRSDAFSVARRGLQEWRAHRQAGLLLEPADSPAAGASVAIAAPVGPFTVVAPCRIVAVVDEQDRYGFAYGTLPGHPEMGEEAFIIERGATGATFKLVAFSRPGQMIARIAGPYNRTVQRAITRGYLSGLASWVEAEVMS